MKKEKIKPLWAGLVSAHKGITLIALVITIIIMLILVGVTITIAIKGGLFNYAKEAVAKQQLGTAQDLCAITASDVVSEYMVKIYVNGEETYSKNELEEKIVNSICGGDNDLTENLNKRSTSNKITISGNTASNIYNTIMYRQLD